MKFELTPRLVGLLCFIVLLSRTLALSETNEPAMPQDRAALIARVAELRAELGRRVLFPATNMTTTSERVVFTSLNRVESDRRAKESAFVAQRFSFFSKMQTESIWVELNDLEKGLYPPERRKDWNQLGDLTVLKEAESVGALVWDTDIVTNSNGTCVFKTVELQQRFGVCDTEPFAKQPTVAYGSGFLVSTQLLATAGHCIMNLGDPNVPPRERMRVVFGYRMRSLTSLQKPILQADVFGVRRVVGQQYSKDGADWALIELDRACGRPPLKIRREGAISLGVPVHIFGYPCGLPLKYADGAKVTVNNASGFFKATLDSYGGNSGSPVIGTNHVVEGILVRGQPDFIDVPIDSRPGETCKRSRLWPDTGVDGEDCTRITELANLVPN